MTALQRIKEIENLLKEAHKDGPCTRAWSTDSVETLLKAFKVMREIALEDHGCYLCQGDHMGQCSGFEKEFEERMK